MQMVHIGDKLWLQRSASGESHLCHEARDASGKLSFEMMSTDLIQIGLMGTAAYFGFVLFGMGCLLALAVRTILALVRKARKQNRPLSAADRQILAQQALCGVSGVILFCLISSIGVKGYAFAAFSCVAAGALAAASAVNGALLAWRTAKKKPEKAKTALRQYLWAGLCFGYTAIVIWFQLYDFVHI